VIKPAGLSSESGIYVSAYSGSGLALGIRIEAGIGQLNLIVQ